MHGLWNQQVNTYLSMIFVAVFALGAAYLLISFSKKVEAEVVSHAAAYTDDIWQHPLIR
jgi:hypothetical protein